MFAFPNSQQTIENYDLKVMTHEILQVRLFGSERLVIFVRPTGILMILKSSPGSFSGLIEQFSNAPMLVYHPKQCQKGTYQNTMHFGPCFICPPGTMNNGSSPILCQSCRSSNTSICYPGAIEKVNTSELTTYKQINPYPQSSESSEFDDLILYNIFKLPSMDIRCLLLSPTFWTWTLLICIFIMFICFRCLSKSIRIQCNRKITKKLTVLLKMKTEDQIWLVVMIGLSLIIFLAFICEFSISFVQRYPIEKISNDDWRIIQCDHAFFNSKFTSSLNLISNVNNDDEKSMFELLDTQNINITIQFISTGFTCEDFMMEQLREQGFKLLWPDYDCSVNDTILIVRAALPKHRIKMQLVFEGPYFVGAMRLCFSSSFTSSLDGKFKAQAINHCELFSTFNQTISSNPNIHVTLTKSINRTMHMSIQDQAIYVGVWLPSITLNIINDQFLFDHHGEYRRYLSSTIITMIEITESDFYIENVQEPIARTYEVAFKTILFASKIIMK